MWRDDPIKISIIFFVYFFLFFSKVALNTLFQITPYQLKRSQNLQGFVLIQVVMLMFEFTYFNSSNSATSNMIFKLSELNLKSLISSFIEQSSLNCDRSKFFLFFLQSYF